MKIELHMIPIRDVVKGYEDKGEDGVVGFDGRLDIRPPYQREFIYEPKQRDLVIDSIRRDLPLNVMYWAKTGEDSYEVMDGQQRTISLCSYATNGFSMNLKYFMNLTKEEQEQINNYKLLIYICEGTDKEKLDWFHIINIAGEKLTQQEMRNATYVGPWLTDAKKKFSKTNCPAYDKYRRYMKGTAIRQEYLERALSWIADRDGITIEEYMAKNQFQENASELWQYYESVMSWVSILFPEYREEMKGLDWGLMCNKYKDDNHNSSKLSKRVTELMLDDEVERKSGIYEYLLSGNEKHLNIRKFSKTIKREKYEKQKGICAKCGKDNLVLSEMEADHITPWSEGGKTNKENCQLLCKTCNRTKSNK